MGASCWPEGAVSVPSAFGACTQVGEGIVPCSSFYTVRRTLGQGLRSPSGSVNRHVGATFGIARPPNRHHRPVRHAGGYVFRSHRGNDPDKRHQERRPAYRKHDRPSAVSTDGNVR